MLLQVETQGLLNTIAGPQLAYSSTYRAASWSFHSEGMTRFGSLVMLSTYMSNDLKTCVHRHQLLRDSCIASIIHFEYAALLSSSCKPLILCEHAGRDIGNHWSSGLPYLHGSLKTQWMPMRDPANPLQGVQLLLDRIDVLCLKVLTLQASSCCPIVSIFFAYCSAPAPPASHVLMSSGQSVKL